MKRLLFITLSSIIALGTWLSVNAQTKRLVLLEEFTNTGCSPCASFAPTLDSLIMVRLGDFVCIKNHANYPSGRDPWYLGDPEALKARMDMYQITGVPSTVIDGSIVNRSIANLNKYIDSRMSAEETVRLTALSQVDDNATLHLTIDAEALTAVTAADLRLHVAVIEEEYTSPERLPNGETHFVNCVIKYLTGAEGYAISQLAEAGDKAAYATEWTIEGMHDSDQLAVVAFLQDMDTKEVIATVYSPRAPESADGAKVVLVQDTPDRICSPHYYATVMFRNIGENPLTSCNVCVEINGSVQEVPWTGSLGYLESAKVSTPDFTSFTLTGAGADNDVKIYISDINGTEARSLPYATSITAAPVAENSAMLSVFTDNKPEEISYVVYNSLDEPVYTSEPMTEKRRFYKTVLPLPGDDCYRIVFSDLGGDGITGDNGNGYYSLYQIDINGKQKIVAQGEYQGETHAQSFELTNAAALQLTGADSQNPAFALYDTTICAYTGGRLMVTDVAGRIVAEATMAADQTYELGSSAPGVYVASFYTGSTVSHIKFTVN